MGVSWRYQDFKIPGSHGRIRMLSHGFLFYIPISAQNPGMENDVDTAVRKQYADTAGVINFRSFVPSSLISLGDRKPGWGKGLAHPGDTGKYGRFNVPEQGNA